MSFIFSYLFLLLIHFFLFKLKMTFVLFYIFKIMKLLYIMQLSEIKFLLTPSNKLRNIIVSDRIVSKESIDNLKGGGVIIGNDQKIDSFISEEEKKIAKELDKPIKNSLDVGII